MEPYIIDTTLRDGEQAPGVIFCIKEKLKIAKFLQKIGVNELEVGTPAMGENEIQDIKIISEKYQKIRISTWCRALRNDLDLAIKTGVRAVNISFPVSHILLSSMNKDQKWIFSHMPDLLNYANDHFEYVSVGAQDASRADISFLLDFISDCENFHVHRVRIADTIGIMNPVSVNDLIKQIRFNFAEITLEFHAHNDFGMATANALVALSSGANAISVTVNGLGERAGNAALEEVIMALKHSFHVDSKYNTALLTDLSNYVANAAHRKIDPAKPIVGDRVLTHETGVHVHSIIKNRKSYQPFFANEVGRKEDEFLFGKHTGKSALKALLKESGLQHNIININKLLSVIKVHSCNLKRSLSKNEVLGILNTLMQNANQHTEASLHDVI